MNGEQVLHTVICLNFGKLNNDKIKYWMSLTVTFTSEINYFRNIEERSWKEFHRDKTKCTET